MATEEIEVEGVIELAGGGRVGLQMSDENAGGAILFEAEDTVFDMMVEEDADDPTKKRMKISFTEDEILELYQLIDEARRCGE